MPSTLTGDSSGCVWMTEAQAENREDTPEVGGTTGVEPGRTDVERSLPFCFLLGAAPVFWKHVSRSSWLQCTPQSPDTDPLAFQPVSAVTSKSQTFDILPPQFSRQPF